MFRKKILLVEDEAALAEIIADSLTTENFHVQCVASGNKALQMLTAGQFDIIVIDVMLPELDGFSVVKQFRRNNKVTPVIFLTSKTMPHDVVTGFECGANDYLKKPFSMEELVIRIKVLLSNNRLLNSGIGDQVVSIGKYLFDPVKQKLHFGKEVIPLTARENEVLLVLYGNSRKHVEKKQLLIAVWGDDNFFNARTLDVFITRLRKYLRYDPEVQIINLRGVGYKLVW